jgi:DNA polymerase IV
MSEQLHVLYVHFGTGDQTVKDRAAEDPPEPELLGLLADFTPLVQALPPGAALVDVRGALRYFDRDAPGLARLIRLRTLAMYGTDCTIGVAVNPLLARMAAHTGPPGAVRVVRPGETAAFLAPLPVGALHGVGPATARTLCAYGLDTVGRVADVAPATLQRVLGAKAGRRLHERARGIDPSTVVPYTPVSRGPSSQRRQEDYHFERDELDADRRRRALLTLADELGFGLRTDGQVAVELSLTVRYSDRSTTTRTRTLAEPSAHTPVLTATAYALHDALGLQRARVRAVSLRAEKLMPAELATRQLSFDPRDAKARCAEEAADRARLRFGAAAAHPAALFDAA